MYLQSLAKLIVNRSIQSIDVTEVAGVWAHALSSEHSQSQVVPEDILNGFLQQCHAKNIDLLMSYIRSTLVCAGYSALQFTQQLSDRISTTAQPNLSSKQRALIAQEMANAERRLVEGADEELQLQNLASKTHQIICG